MEKIVENSSENSQSPAPTLELLSSVDFKVGGSPEPKTGDNTNILNSLLNGAPTKETKEAGTGENGTPPATPENNSQQNNTNTEQQSENEPIEIEAEQFSYLLSDATEGKIQNLDQIFQILEENQRLQQLVDNPSNLFKDPNQKMTYEFLNDYKAGDFDSGIQAFAKLKSLDIANMKPEDALKEKYVLENMKYGIGRVESEKMFQAEVDEKYSKYGELANQFISKDGVDAKKALSEMQSKFTTPKVDEQQAAQEQQLQVQREQYAQAVNHSLNGFKSLMFDITGKEENNFNFEVANTNEVADAMNDPQGFLNSRWTGSNGFNVEQMKNDIAILQNLDRIIEGISTHAMTLGKEQAIRERNNIQNRNDQQASNANQGGSSIPKNFTEAIMNADIKRV